MPEFDESSSILISASSDPEPAIPKIEPAQPVHVQQLEALVRHCEMQPEMTERAVQLILQAFTEMETEGPRAVAGAIKKAFDTEFGQYWHCIVGKAYASHVSHGKIVYK